MQELIHRGDHEGLRNVKFLKELHRLEGHTRTIESGSQPPQDSKRQQAKQ
uniref:Uncharacterized protein n=1 Tax=Rhizophora mucronata TaxID=61149 RepID=A0A2P2J454_RHIMU